MDKGCAWKCKHFYEIPESLIIECDKDYPLAEDRASCEDFVPDYWSWFKITMRYIGSYLRVYRVRAIRRLASWQK